MLRTVYDWVEFSFKVWFATLTANVLILCMLLGGYFCCLLVVLLLDRL